MDVKGMLAQGFDAPTILEMLDSEDRAKQDARQQQQSAGDAGVALRRLVHVIRGGRPSRDPNWVPAQQLPQGPGMLGPVNGAFPANSKAYPPRTPSVGVRG